MVAREAGNVYALVVGALVAQLREQQGWTQGALAAHVGLTQSTVSRIEGGQAHPGPYELHVIADAFDLTTAELAALIDGAHTRVEKTARKESGSATGADWWKGALAAIGLIGLAGLAGFAVAAALGERKKHVSAKRQGSRRSRRSPRRKALQRVVRTPRKVGG